jgi:hypothetical protein
MKRSTLLAASVLVPVLAWAGDPAPSATGFLNRVPALPANAQLAYAQWNDNNGDLTPGTAFKQLEDAIQNATMSTTMGATTMPSASQQASAQTNAQAFAAQYGTPEGRAKLQSMSPAQLMALSQQMQGQMGYAQPTMAPQAVSDHDGAILRQLGTYPKTADVRTKTAAIQMESVKIQQQWDADNKAIGDQDSAERGKLPICPGEAGEPSDLAIKNVALKYADKHIALATSYLPKFQPLLTQLKQTVEPEIAYADNSWAKWSQLQNAALKSQMHPEAAGAEANGYSDAGTVLTFVEDISKKAAAAAADKARINKIYADAKGC